MKKYFRGFLLMLMVCLLVGCGAYGEPEEKGNESETVSSEASTETEALENGSEETEAKESKAEKTQEEDTRGKWERVETGDSKSGGKELAQSGTLMTPANSGKLHVDGTLIKNEKDETVQLKGLSTHGIAWFPDYINNDLFREFRKEWDCNVIRLAMYTEEYGGYVNGGDKKNLKRLIDNGVTYATDNDMYVIIDWHILSDGNPNKNKEEAKKFFDEMSGLYKEHDNVIYEICNEPNGGVEWSEIKAYAEEVIPVIRKNDKEAIIIVGTPNWSQYVDQAAANPIKGYENIMYALHFYADTHRDELRQTMENAILSGLPIFVTEYGVCDASGGGAINKDESAKWMSLLNKYSVSCCAWNISNKGETSAIFGTWTSKSSNFKEDDLTSSGKWIYSMLTGKEEYEPAPDRPKTSQTGGNNGNNGNSNGDGSNGGNNNGNNGGQREIPAEAIKIVDGNLTIYLQEISSWNTEEGLCHQYNVTILNNGDKITSWEVHVPFDTDVTLQQSWCGHFSANKNVLTISNESYNGTIEEGCTIKDIGFIAVH